MKKTTLLFKMKNNRSNYYYSVQITSKFSINMKMKNLKYICFKYFLSAIETPA